MTDLADVLVVIPCLNEEAHLPRLLEALVRESGEALIVVADGGSTDASRDIVRQIAGRHHNVRLLDNPKRLQSAAVNLAAATYGAGRRWLVRIDAHCGYPANYVSGLAVAAKTKAVVSVVVPMVTVGVTCFQRAVAAAQNSVLGTGGSAHRHVGEGRYVDHGHHALFDISAFLAAGGYDETFSHNEDAELDFRLTQVGGRLWLEPALALTYFPRKTTVTLFRQYLGYGAGRAKTVQRHRPPLKVRQIAPLAVAPAVALAIAGLIWWPLVLPAFVWASACLGGGALLGLRAGRKCEFAAGWAAMVMHFAWSLGFLRQTILGARPGPYEPTIEGGLDMGDIEVPPH